MNKLLPRNPEPLAEGEWHRRAYHLIKRYAPALSTCQWCLGPNITGYICSCGWNNSYDPDLYVQTEDGQYVLKNQKEK